MNKEDLKTGKKLQSRIEEIEKKIDHLDSKQKMNHIEINITSYGSIYVRESDIYTDKANHDLEFLNQLYRDNVLRTLESCKEELERKFELLGNESEFKSEN